MKKKGARLRARPLHILRMLRVSQQRRERHTLEVVVDQDVELTVENQDGKYVITNIPDDLKDLALF